jgi:mannose-6-phosphate isomerase-like protein (cupin superfamily)
MGRALPGRGRIVHSPLRCDGVRGPAVLNLRGTESPPVELHLKLRGTPPRRPREDSRSLFTSWFMAIRPRNRPRGIRSASVAGSLTILKKGDDMSNDATSVAPHVYKPVVDNERVRVLDVKTDAGGSTEMHHHPDMVLYAITDCTWDLTSPEGETARVELKAGDSAFIPATDHAAVDFGSVGSHGILVELK